jgi:hypothetical protein
MGCSVKITLLLEHFYSSNVHANFVGLVISVLVYPRTCKSKFLSFGVQFPSFNWVCEPCAFFVLFCA